MAIQVIIPTALRQYAGGQSRISADGATVGEVLEQIKVLHPDFSKQIFDESGSLRSFINVYRNDDDIRYLDGTNTTVSDRDELSIIPAIAGGRTKN